MISHEEDGRREGSWEGSKRSGLIGMAELLRVILPEMSDLLNRILVQEIRGKWPLSTGFLTDSTVGKSSLCGSDGRVIEAPMA
ncbi:hypothetical protein Tco_1309477 [Tanacetum coccineum]